MTSTKKNFFLFTLILTLCWPCINCQAQGRQVLKENIVKANPGDFIVTAQGNNFTVLHIRDKGSNNLVVEEITAPASRIPKYRYSWRQWIEIGAPGHTAWIRYNLNTSQGTMQDMFSYTKNCWFKVQEADNFLTKLLNLSFNQIPDRERKQMGSRSRHADVHDLKNLWQPKLIVNGQAIPDAKFTAWKTRWPNDGSELAGKMIEIYTPVDDVRYPSYFPYWLQISGMIGKAKVRIIDSGMNLKSPKADMDNRETQNQ